LNEPGAPVALLESKPDILASFQFIPDNRIVGLAENGDEYVWRYFPDRESLVLFAQKNLPRDENGAIKLTSHELCLIGLSRDDCLSDEPATDN
jgi:hypothetical protein